MTSETLDKRAMALVNRAFVSRYPVVYIISPEEERIENVLAAVSNDHYGDERPVVRWTASQGFEPDIGAGEEQTDPIVALEAIKSQEEDRIYLMKDLPGYFSRDHRIERHLRDFYVQMKERNSHLVISYPLLELPPALKKEIYVVELELPTETDIADYLSDLLYSLGMVSTSAERVIAKGAKGLRGLSFNEIRHLFYRIFSNKKMTLDTVMTEISEEKAQVLKKESCLEVDHGDFDIDGIGGLENLKRWVEARSGLFSKEAIEAGVPPPSGVLFMGVSGCGKSLAAKTIASAWNLPLVRLDMALVMSGVYGAPEYAFDRAIRIVESIAPMVLWIDEIENSFGYDSEASAGTNVSIFSTFLTWMQEKPANVFVAATANRIQKIPAEMIRKGRFDQVFYVDLPKLAERKDIFQIHINRNDAKVRADELETLANMTEGWSGAEIEQAVNAAKVDAFNAKTDCGYREILMNVGKNVPLSTTMKEQVKALRTWSVGRTTPASSNIQPKRARVAR